MSTKPPAVALADKLLYSVAEAAGLLGCSTTAVYDLIHAGDLRTVRPFTEYRITRAALDAFVAGLEEADARETAQIALLAKRRRGSG